MEAVTSDLLDLVLARGRYSWDSSSSPREREREREREELMLFPVFI